jgi:hypothetical protein
MSLSGDNPIRHADEDALDRVAMASAFARQVLSLDASEGAVVGVLGAWGSGKTSFLNLARDDFAAADTTVLDFNPWMFSGAEQLVESFFNEIGAQLRVRPDLAQIGDDLAEYGEAFAGLGWVPVAGPWIERFRSGSKALSSLLQRRREGVGGRRKKVQDALRKLERPLIVVLDDIDRLSTDEIRDIFKLVRLTASFPNIIYVLAFDRGRVEKALSEQGVPGRDYLEKILQVVVDLPAIPEEVLNRQIFAALNQAIAEAGDPEDVDDQVWPDVFMEVVRPLIRNMRDVRRYAGAVRGTVENIGGQVALADLLAVEAVRLFLPDVFARLPDSVEGLCTPSERGFGGREEEAEPKHSVERLVEAGGEDEAVVRALIQRLFPFGQRHIGGTSYGSDWTNRFLRDRRIAHESILRLYLERVAGQQLTNHYDAKRAWEAMDNRSNFDAFLRGLDSERQEDVIAGLEAYEDEYTLDQVVPGVIVLSNLRPDLPERPGGMASFGTRTVVNRVTYRLLRSLNDQEKVEAAMKQILPEVTTLSAKWELISQVGYREGAGHKLASEDAAAAFEAEWRDEVRSASGELLAKDHDLVRVLVFAKREAAEGEEVFAIPADPRVTLAVLKGARSEARSQYLGTRAVRREFRLSWDTLVDLYGEESNLLARIEELKASDIEVEADLLELIQKYIDGWRHED